MVMHFQLHRCHSQVLLGSSIVFFLDALSKALVRHNLSPGESIPVVSGIFQITRTHNTGAAFSMFYQHPEVLTVVAGLLVAVFTLYMLCRNDLSRQEIGGYSFLLGGALGNLMDRIRLGAVTDFLDFIGIHYPVFNLADSFILIGLVMLLLHYVKQSHTPSRS